MNRTRKARYTSLTLTIAPFKHNTKKIDSFNLEMYKEMKSKLNPKTTWKILNSIHLITAV
jgi:hypothetical protein